MKKSIVGLTALAIVCSVAVSASGLIGCGGKNPTNQTPAKPISFESAYEYSAIGGIGLLNSFAPSATPMSTIADVSVPALLSRPDNDLSIAAQNARDLSEEEKAAILKNLAIARDTLNGGVVKSEVKPSDREGYALYYTVSVADITGKNKIYAFYYNTSADNSSDKTSVADVLDASDDSDGENHSDDKKDEDDDKHDAENGEVQETLNGIAVLDGAEYVVEGKKTVEQDESEYEFTITYDANNYVIIQQEIESDEQEFKYVCYADGNKVYETEVEYETDENGEIELKFSVTENGVELEYGYEFFENDKGSFVKIQFENGKTETQTLIKITVDTDGNVAYEFISVEAENDGGGNSDSDGTHDDSHDDSHDKDSLDDSYSGDIED